MDDYRELYEQARAEGRWGPGRLWAGRLLPDLALAFGGRISGGGVRRFSKVAVFLRFLRLVFAVLGAAIAATGLLSLALAFLYARDLFLRLGSLPEMFGLSLISLNLLAGVLCLLASREVWTAAALMRPESRVSR